MIDDGDRECTGIAVGAAVVVAAPAAAAAAVVGSSRVVCGDSLDHEAPC